ncbi:UNVERIFIED_CONTAM: hypothetical protein RMT77_015177 [Armadillidium vulgare]
MPGNRKSWSQPLPIEEDVRVGGAPRSRSNYLFSYVKWAKTTLKSMTLGLHPPLLNCQEFKFLPVQRTNHRNKRHHTPVEMRKEERSWRGRRGRSFGVLPIPGMESSREQTLIRGW